MNGELKAVKKLLALGEYSAAERLLDTMIDSEEDLVDRNTTNAANFTPEDLPRLETRQALIVIRMLNEWEFAVGYLNGCGPERDPYWEQSNNNVVRSLEKFPQDIVYEALMQAKGMPSRVFAYGTEDVIIYAPDLDIGNLDDDINDLISNLCITYQLDDNAIRVYRNTVAVEPRQHVWQLQSIYEFLDLRASS
jgi:hypothetical protein